MLDALIGGVIMVVATTSLLYSIEVAERAFADAGRYPPSPSERELLEATGLNDADKQDEFIKSNVVWDCWGDRCK